MRNDRRHQRADITPEMSCRGRAAAATAAAALLLPVFYFAFDKSRCRDKCTHLGCSFRATGTNGSRPHLSLITQKLAKITKMHRFAYLIL